MVNTYIQNLSRQTTAGSFRNYTRCKFLITFWAFKVMKFTTTTVSKQLQLDNCSKHFRRRQVHSKLCLRFISLIKLSTFRFQSTYYPFISEICWTNIVSLSKLSTTDAHLLNMRLQKAENARFSLKWMRFQQQSPEGLEWACKYNWCASRFILWPLLTATASFMGTNALVKINEEWWEPSIMWFIIAPRKEKIKTVALKCILKPFRIDSRLSGKKTPISKNHLHHLSTS